MKRNSPKTILVDADALVALVKSDDSNHELAKKLFYKLEKAGYTFIYTPFTISEVVTVISHKVSQKKASQTLKTLRSQMIFEFPLPYEKIDLIDKWFTSQNKKKTSYADCYNMAVMEFLHESIAAIFSFDKVYKENGFRLAQELE